VRPSRARRRGGDVERPMCANCFFFREGDRPFTGRCLHPAQRLPTEPQPLVRGRELRCRDSWEHHNWLPKHFEPVDQVIHVRIASAPQRVPIHPVGSPSVVHAQRGAAETQIPLEIVVDGASSVLIDTGRLFRVADDIALSLMGHAPLPPQQERKCGNCRCFVASADGVTGLCTNLLVSTTFHHVAASGLACQSLLGCWWQPQEPAPVTMVDIAVPIDPIPVPERVYPLADS
jgi:hypothetical protein